jgi:hypothetical protein
MDKYEEEIYKFLTERTNFEAMLKVNSNFRFIKDELLRQFWNKVAAGLNSKINIDVNKWKVLNPQNKQHPKAKLIVYKEIWRQSETHPFVGVAWEGLYLNPYFGVYNNLDCKLINSDKLRTSLEDIRFRLSFQVDTNWWPMWQYGRYNFSEDNNLVNILPDSLETSAEEYSDSLIRLLNEVEVIIDKVVLS